MQVVVENALPRRKRRRYPARARSQPVKNKRLIKSKARRRPQRQPEIHAPGICQKWQKAGSGEKILSDSLGIPRGKRDPFVGLRNGEHGRTMLSKSDVVEEFEGLSSSDGQSRLLRQIDLKPKGSPPILQGAAVVPVHGLADAGAEIENPAFFRPPQIACEGVILPDVNAIHESHLGAEIGRGIVVVRGKSEVPAAIRCVGPQRIALLRSDAGITRGKRQAIPLRVKILPRPAVYSLQIDDLVLGKFQPGIQRSHAIACVGEIAAGKKAANVRLIAELARDANHFVGRPRVVRAAFESLPRPPVVDDQGAQRPFAELSRHARAELRVRDPARKKQIDRCRKESRIFNEERPLLREKNREALVDGDLRVVRFHLAEIRVQRGVERQRILGHKFRIESGTMLEFIQEAWRAAARLIQKVVVGQQPIRNELNVPPWRHILQAGKRRKLLRQSFHAPRDARPIVEFTFAENYAIQRHSPGLLRIARKPQAFERNRKEDNVAVAGDAARVIPQRVEAEVVSLPFGVDRIGLHPERIGVKVIRAVKIPKGVQQHTHAVILIGGLALRKMRSDLARFIAANEDGIKILVVVREVSGSGLCRRRAVARVKLAKIGDRQFRFARKVFQEIFKFGCVMHTRNLRQRNLSLIWRWRCLRGDTWDRGEKENNPKNRIPDDRAHLGYLYIACIILSRNCKVVQMLSCSARWRGLVEASVWPLRGRRKDFIAPRKRRRFPEHGRNGAVLVLAELDGVLYRHVVESAAETIEQFQLGPDRGRLRRAFARANHFQRFELLPLLFQDDDHVGGGAGPQGQQHKLHRARRLVRGTVGIDGYRVPGRAGCNKFLLANPLYGSGLHPAASEEGSLNRVCSHVCTMDSLPLAAAAKLPTGR